MDLSILFSRFSIPNFRLSTYNYRFSIFDFWLPINIHFWMSEVFFISDQEFSFIFDYQLLNPHFWSFALYFWLSKSTLNYKFTNVTYLLFLIIWNIFTKKFLIIYDYENVRILIRNVSRSVCTIRTKITPV